MFLTLYLLCLLLTPLFGAAEPVSELRNRLHGDERGPCIVEGQVLSPASAVGESRAGFFLGDDSGGILVWHDQAFRDGERVLATGECYSGTSTRLEMTARELVLLPGHTTPLKPRRLFPEEARRPEWQSTLAEVDGVITDVNRVNGVEIIWMRAVTPFRAVYRLAPGVRDGRAVEPGMRVIVRGILAPQTDSKESPRPHELILRSGDDFVIVDAKAAPSRQLLYLFLSLVLLAGVWILSLRRVVQERTQALKEALRKAEEGSCMKSSFVANMSHEIRTPLNAIIGFSDLLMDGAQGEQQRLLATIRVSADTLLAVINDVLDFSKIESGRLDLVPESVSPHTVIEEAMDIVAPSAAQKGLDLGYLVEPGVPSVVRLDGARLRQVLMNLLSNAVKFTEEGSVELLLRAEKDRDGFARLSFAVKDSGIGIANDQIGKLFQPFQQIDSSVRRRHGGTGLGLVISRHLIRLMHGDLSVGSTPGKGSVFTASVLCPVESWEPVPTGLPAAARIAIQIERPWTRQIVTALVRQSDRPVVPPEQATIVLSDREPAPEDRKEGRLWVELTPRIRLQSTLPGHAVVSLPLKPSVLWEACRSDAPQSAVSPSVNVAPAPLRILVADDNAVNVKVVTSLLSRLGHPAEVATNGKEVLAAMERQPFDLVFLDIQMPEMDGLEAARRIREQGHLKERPWLVALTANAMSSDREEYLAAGMNDHVPKPIGLKQLAAALQRAEAGLHESEAAPKSSAAGV